MNAILVMFFLAMFLNDFLFKEALMIKIYIYLFMGYFIIYIFTNSSKFHSAYKNLQLAIFSQSFDPTVYSKLKINVEKCQEFLKKYQEKYGEKITMTLLVTKVIGLTLKKYPEFNCAIKCGKLIKRDTIDLGLLVNLNGKVNLKINFI